MARLRYQPSLPELKEATKDLEPAHEETRNRPSPAVRVCRRAARREAKLSENVERDPRGLARQVDGPTLPVVTAEHISEVVAMWTGIPVTPSRMMSRKAPPHGRGPAKRIVGQDEAIHQTRQGCPTRPRRSEGPASGPSAVSSSWAPPASARPNWRAPGRVHVRQRGVPDQARHVGVHGEKQRHPPDRRAPGYVGYEEGGQLTEAVRRKSYSRSCWTKSRRPTRMCSTSCCR